MLEGVIFLCGVCWELWRRILAMKAFNKDYIRGRSDGFEEVYKQEKQVKSQEYSEKPTNHASDKPGIPVVTNNQTKESGEDDK